MENGWPEKIYDDLVELWVSFSLSLLNHAPRLISGQNEGDLDQETYDAALQGTPFSAPSSPRRWIRTASHVILSMSTVLMRLQLVPLCFSSPYRTTVTSYSSTMSEACFVHRTSGMT